MARRRVRALIAILFAGGLLAVTVSWRGDCLHAQNMSLNGIEREIPAASEEALRAMGHRLRSRDDRSTNMLNAIQIYPGSGALSAGADPREAHAASW